MSLIPGRAGNVTLNTDWDIQLTSLSSSRRVQDRCVHKILILTITVFLHIFKRVPHESIKAIKESIDNFKRHTVSLLETHFWFIFIPITKPFFTHNLNYHNHSSYNGSYLSDFFSPLRLQFIMSLPWGFITRPTASWQRIFLSFTSTFHAFTSLQVLLHEIYL